MFVWSCPGSTRASSHRSPRDHDVFRVHHGQSKKWSLYVGVTNDLVRRVYQHREGAIAGFTERYGVKDLVYFEEHDDPRNAIQREKNIKHWSRAWKLALIERENPDWKDLFEKVAT